MLQTVALFLLEPDYIKRIACGGYPAPFSWYMFSRNLTRLLQTSCRWAIT